MLRNRQRPGLVTRTSGAAAPFSPLNIANLAAWYDASDTATITSSLGSVSQWNDKSGNARHATQGIGSNQPVTGTRSINGLNVLDFEATNDNLLLPSALYGLSNGPWTYLIVYQADTAASAQRMLVGGSPITYGIFANTGANNGINVRQTNTVPATSYTFDTSLRCWAGRRNGATLEALINGNLSSGSISTASDATISVFTIGSSSVSMDGMLGEIVMYSRNLTNAEYNQVGQYLAAKWGFTWTAI